MVTKQATTSATVAALGVLEHDVRTGSVTAPRADALPRLRLLERLERLRVLCPSRHAVAEVRALPPEHRICMQVENSIAHSLERIRRMGACGACTLNPCYCAAMPPLQLSHRLWVVMHHKEALRTTATGKLLLLAHPHATLLVSGVAEHDAELAQVALRASAVCLYPSDDALTPTAVLESSGCGGATGGNALDLIVLDGTWNQARAILRTLPPSLRKVSVDLAGMRSLFGTCLRKQGREREQAGRVSTLEAYGALALALGDDAEELRSLDRYTRILIAALRESGAYYRPTDQAQRIGRVEQLRQVQPRGSTAMQTDARPRETE